MMPKMETNFLSAAVVAQSSTCKRVVTNTSLMLGREYWAWKNVNLKQFNHNPVNPLWIRVATKQSHMHWFGHASVQQVEGIRVNSLHKKGRIVS